MPKPPKRSGSSTDTSIGVSRAEDVRRSGASRSGQLPAGDVRLTVNIRSDLHLKLKIRAAEQRTTMGELIEDWIDSW